MDILQYNANFIFGNTIYKNGGRYGPLKKKNMNIMVMLQGECTVENDNRKIKVSEGEACFTLSQDFLTITLLPEICSSSIWCQTLDVSSARKVINESGILPPVLNASEHLKELIHIGIELGYGEVFDPYEQRLRYAAGKAIFSEYLHLANYDETTESIPIIVNKTKHYIDNFYMKKCDMDQVSKTIGVTKRHLNRVFEQHTGITPTKYVWKVREKHALKFLDETNSSFTQIAELCGFKNPYHFSNYMKDKFGKNPTELRQEFEGMKNQLVKDNANLITKI